MSGFVSGVFVVVWGVLFLSGVFRVGFFVVLFEGALAAPPSPAPAAAPPRAPVALRFKFIVPR